MTGRLRERRSGRCAGLVAAVAGVITMAGCVNLAPDYARPALPVPARFGDTAPARPADNDDATRVSAASARPAAAAAAPAVSATSAAPSGPAGLTTLAWQQVFIDPRLRAVIVLALDNNRDLKVALLDIDKARAQYRIQRASELPTVDASASRTSSRSSAATSYSGRSVVSRVTSADVGISNWELDLFGRLRNLGDEALETWLGTAETQRATRLALVAEVATDWLDLAADRQRLALARQTLASQLETLKLTTAQRQIGTASGLDVAQVETSVESARADVVSYDLAVAQARIALELVVGAPVADGLLPDDGATSDAVGLAPVPADLSSSVLLDRPDVLAAEHTLKAANADIGAARAAFFPSITLTAEAGRSSTQLSSLFSAGTRTWSFAPAITVPIFEGGALKANLDVAKIEKEISVANYEQAIQTAFSEVADALATRARIDDALAAQAGLVDAADRSYRLADARYRRGADSYLATLDAQRSLYSARQTMITLRLQESTNRVSLYKTLGGGADASATLAAASPEGSGKAPTGSR